ncbi:hypothetical protein ACFFX0_17670 [Citricoccus parietis]|uniref:Uncharacterized protein n=1 Tax=Citricoccus parietis TaxID=592307 RepID=A0ABV5G1X0_9MICC
MCLGHGLAGFARRGRGPADLPLRRRGLHSGEEEPEVRITGPFQIRTRVSLSLNIRLQPIQVLRAVLHDSSSTAPVVTGAASWSSGAGVAHSAAASAAHWDCSCARCNRPLVVSP